MLTTLTSVTCRLPQTPRTPSVAMSHYFDDMFQRSIDAGVPASPTMTRVRRSSTARSIGARSDFDASTNGVDDDDTTSVFQDHEDDEKSREKEEADQHMHRYVSDQLSRYKDGQKSERFEHDDEIEPKADH